MSSIQYENVCVFQDSSDTSQEVAALKEFFGSHTMHLVLSLEAGGMFVR